MKNIININQVIDLLIKNNNFLLIHHDYPDADTIGSSIALCAALRLIGKSAHIYFNDISKYSKYKLYLEKYLLNNNDQKFNLKFLITCDVSNISLISNFYFNIKQNDYKINLSIDHHKFTNDSLYATYNYINYKKSSCGEIIYQIIKKMNIPINIDISNGIYMAISGDTGTFKFKNTKSETHKIAAWCLDNKVDNYKINFQLFDSINLKTYKCLPWLIEQTKFYYKNKIAVLVLNEEELYLKFNIYINELNDFIYLPRKIINLELILIFKLYINNDNIKLSIRSNGYISAFKLSKHFGGGGHEKAAGALLPKLSTNLNKIIDQIINMIQSDVKGDFKS